MDGLIEYRVTLSDGNFSFAFDCHAEDEEHAKEQAENAYADCVITGVTTKDPDLTVIRPACLTPECRGDQHARGLCKTCIATFYRHRTPAIEAQMISEGWILPRKAAGRKPGPMAEAMKLADIPQHSAATNSTQPAAYRTESRPCRAMLTPSSHHTPNEGKNMNATATTETTATEQTWVEKIGKPAYDSIVDMVNALECDYDRLQELRMEKEELQTAIDDACSDHEGDDKDAKATIGDEEAEATKAMQEWQEENAEELAQLEAEAGDCKDREEAEQRIQDDALSVQVRSGWYTPGDQDDDSTKPAEFELLLSTGGPAVRIVGELDGNGEPDRAWLEVQDWGKPWTEYYTTGIGEVCLAYARCFTYSNE